ncbi:MAG: hypothetical protein ABSF38_04210 [Verrucomicrobiota bacterium]|jgi:hypothetical protein
MILLSLASKQIWPHVLTAARLKPERVFLLHTQDAGESQEPAQRLKRFFDDTGLVPRGGTRLELVPHDDFGGIEHAIDVLQAKHQLPLADCRVNFTGGNKLMAAAAFRWAARRGVSSFYLERGNRLTRFEPRDGDVLTRTETLDGHVADGLDPVALLRCQIDASEIERPGQALTLNEKGRKLADVDFFKSLQSGNDLRPLLCTLGEADREHKDGDPLEFSTAAALLKLGVPRVQRSLRLKVKSSLQTSTRLAHVEIDLLFSWAGRLWLVDCKDRMPAENLADNLRRLLPPLSMEAGMLFDRVRNELSISQTKVMKEDLLSVREAGGLLGHVVCVRKAEPREEVVQYARLNHIDVVPKMNLVVGLRNLLDPGRPADADQLADLASRFSKP